LRFFRTGDIHGYPPYYVEFFRWSFLWWKELPIFFDGTALGVGASFSGLRTSSLPFTMCSPHGDSIQRTVRVMGCGCEENTPPFQRSLKKILVMENAMKIS
jgi:hypothetical protein